MRNSYNSAKAGEFWSKRLKSTDPLSAVLTYEAPKILNKVYDRWEIKNLISALPRSLKGSRALDLGSGTGRIALTLARLGAEVTAVDVSEAMLTHLEKSAKKEKLFDRIITIRGSSAELPSADRAFDLITCFGLLEHLPEETRTQTLLEAFRVIRARRNLLVVVNNEDCIFLKGSYSMKKQRDDGYFVSLVGYDWLNSVCRANGKKVNIIASNPMYGLLHYYVSIHEKEKFGRESNFANFARQMGVFDLGKTTAKEFLSQLSSHIMVEIR